MEASLCRANNISKGFLKNLANDDNEFVSGLKTTDPGLFRIYHMHCIMSLSALQGDTFKECLRTVPANKNRLGRHAVIQASNLPH